MKFQRGFTLIEMMVCLALLATLASAAIPIYQRQEQQRNEEELRVALRDIRSAIDRYGQLVEEGVIEKDADMTNWPASLDLLVDGVVNKKSPNKEKIYLLRRIPRDPFCDCDGRKNTETWRVRASTQAPGETTGGKDVWDVSSTSSQPGLNGIPYAQW
ncbi:type II secretion system protein [Kosakonia sp. MUSA4]|uniref:type II secretion system protein n=1 Tax=Kosakonia sp. MUSA4 TaxID=2067958 RepID=UPI00159B4A1D|nr:type II secretion system protein [Kosakonia sp. MUSA4]QJT79470.1 general secretion pathway protein GspG [Kosakonia sp. MUSA4]